MGRNTLAELLMMRKHNQLRGGTLKQSDLGLHNRETLRDQKYNCALQNRDHLIIWSLFKII